MVLINFEILFFFLNVCLGHFACKLYSLVDQFFYEQFNLWDVYDIVSTYVDDIEMHCHIE